jgi:hypothetical protein
LQSFEQVDCLNAVKHGNGRDWWVLFRKAGSLVQMATMIGILI